MMKYIFGLCAQLSLFTLLTGCGGFGTGSLLSTAANGLQNLASNRSEVASVAQIACDGVTDDTAAMQAQVNASVGNNLIIGGSHACIISKTITIPSNSHITINGSVLLAANSNVTMFSTDHVYNVVIDGSGVIDGNWNQQGAVCGTTVGCAGVNAWGGGNITVGSASTRLTIQHVKNWPVNIVAVAGAQMINITALDSGNSVEFAGGTHDCNASGMRVSGIHDMGFAFYGGVQRCTLSNSITSGNDSDGITILSDDGQAGPCSDISISNVESYGNMAASAISIAANAGVDAKESNITVTNLYSHDNGRSDIYDPSGFNVTFVGLKTVGPAKITAGSEIVMISPIELGVNASPPSTATNVPVSAAPVSTDVSVPADASILGVVDGVYPSGGGAYYVSGWVCLTHDPAAILVDLYLNGSAGMPGAIAISRNASGLASEGAVAAACQSTGSSYRFSISLSADFVNANHGAKIYLHGISPIAGFTNNILINSGNFTVP